MDKVSHTFIVKVKQELDVLAHDGMLLSQKDTFEHGVSVGTYQGLNLALQILDAILRDSDN
jgi:hypothetical protein